MKHEHIISILDSRPFSALDQSDLEEIQEHIVVCESCRHAYQAAQVSTALIQERAKEVFEPSPFFQTRVLAALRERETATEKWAFSRLWRTAGGLVSTMVATVATLAILTFFVPGSQTTEVQNSAPAVNGYAAESVMLGENTDEATDSDVLTTLYAGEDNAVK